MPPSSDPSGLVPIGRTGEGGITHSRNTSRNHTAARGPRLQPAQMRAFGRWPATHPVRSEGRAKSRRLPRDQKGWRHEKKTASFLRKCETTCRKEAGPSGLRCAYLADCLGGRANALRGWASDTNFLAEAGPRQGEKSRVGRAGKAESNPPQGGLDAVWQPANRPEMHQIRGVEDCREKT